VASITPSSESNFLGASVGGWLTVLHYQIQSDVSLLQPSSMSHTLNAVFLESPVCQKCIIMCQCGWELLLAVKPAKNDLIKTDTAHSHTDRGVKESQDLKQHLQNTTCKIDGKHNKKQYGSCKLIQ